MEKIERNSAHLVVIRNELDFEIVGAFKSLDTALEFAEIIQQETLLEIQDNDMPELRLVAGHPSYGFGSTDSKAIKTRFKSRAFSVD